MILLSDTEYDLIYDNYKVLLHSKVKFLQAYDDKLLTDLTIRKLAGEYLADQEISIGKVTDLSVKTYNVTAYKSDASTYILGYVEK